MCTALIKAKVRENFLKPYEIKKKLDAENVSKNKTLKLNRISSASSGSYMKLLEVSERPEYNQVGLIRPQHRCHVQLKHKTDVYTVTAV